MENVFIMKSSQPLNQLTEDVPYLSLFKVGALPLVFRNFLVEIPSVRQFHYNAQHPQVLLKERLLISDNVGMPINLEM